MTQRKENRSSEIDKSVGRHPFGGCGRLLNQYQTVGRELLRYERSSRGYRSFSAFTEFREAVAFIPLEVLESYLEDLLDLDVDEDRLFICREAPLICTYLLSLSGMGGALAVGLYAASNGASMLLSFALTVAIALPFAVAWHHAPRGSLPRRLAFAKVVSTEVSRRRGRDKGGDQDTAFAIEDLLIHKPAGTLQGAARNIIH